MFIDIERMDGNGIFHWWIFACEMASSTIVKRYLFLWIRSSSVDVADPWVIVQDTYLLASWL